MIYKDIKNVIYGREYIKSKHSGLQTHNRDDTNFCLTKGFRVVAIEAGMSRSNFSFRAFWVIISYLKNISSISFISKMRFTK
jgi:hypothetical protein